MSQTEVTLGMATVNPQGQTAVQTPTASSLLGPGHLNETAKGRNLMAGSPSRARRPPTPPPPPHEGLSNCSLAD